MIYLLLIILLIFVLMLSLETPYSIRRKRRSNCYKKPYMLNGSCVESCPVFINENNIDCIDTIPPNKYALGNKIVSKCPMYYTDSRLCGYPFSNFVASAISNDGKYKTLISEDGYVVNFNNLEWSVSNQSAIFNNVIKLLMNDTGNKLLVLNSNKVYVSTDYGKTWSLLLANNINVIDVDMHPDGKIVHIIDRTTVSSSIIYTIETLNQDGILVTVKIFENIIINQISIGKFQTQNYSDYFVIFRTEGNNLIQPYPNQDNKCFMIRGISSSNPSAFLLNFYYTFDDIRTKPYDTEMVSHIELSKDARIIYVITTENSALPRTYLYTGVVLSYEPSSIVNVYRSNTDIGSLFYLKSSYYGKNNIGVIYNNATNTEFLVKFSVEYDSDILVGNPLNVTSTLTSLKGDFNTISLSRDSVLENDGKHELISKTNGYIFESKDYGNTFEMMK